jgi:hypothetical protein
MDTYLGFIKQEQNLAATAHVIAVIERRLYSEAVTPAGKAFHLTNWTWAMRREKKHAANARHMLMELLNK